MPFRPSSRAVLAATRRAAACCALAGFSAAAQAPLDIRVALVIGNSAYAGPAALVNPANDAKTMAAALRRLGFSVTELRDGSRAQMAQAIETVRAGLNGKQGVGMLYYAGHGVQLDWRNYMVPIDAKMSTAADVPTQSVDVESVIAAFKAAGNRMNILVLDACRDNPFAGTASAKGLAQLDAPPGTFLAYATAPGNVAEDGTGGDNGLYTGYLVQELARPAKIEDVFKRVRFQVRQKSQGRQIPWESTSLEDDFFFDPEQARAEAAARSRETASKEAASKEAAALEAFNREKADWDRIAGSRNADDFYAFLRKYPSGKISELATATLERLAEARTIQVANKEGLVQVPAKDRFRLGDSITTTRRDDLTKIVIQQGTSRVTEITADTVRVGRALLTREGATISNQFVANWDPPRQESPAGDYAIGKKWTFRTIQTNLNGSKGWVEGEVRIVALEDVTVPAGTFKAYRVELTSIAEWGERVKLTRWLQPDWGFPIKALREIRPARGVPTLETVEMISRHRGPG
jgi:uncharacterized caspase-like protein